MTEHEAYRVAIVAMNYMLAFVEHNAQLYDKYGEHLADPEERRSARSAAESKVKLTAAIALFKAKLEEAV